MGTLDPKNDLVKGIVEVGSADLVATSAGRQNRRLVCEVCQVGAREARRLARQNGEIDVVT